MDLLENNHQGNINKTLDEFEKEKTAMEEENDYCDANFSKFEKIYDKRLKETKTTQTTVSNDKENKRGNDSKRNGKCIGFFIIIRKKSKNLLLK